MLADILHIFGLIASMLIVVVLAVGFWRGLSMRPHRPDNRAARHPVWWWYNGL